LLGRRNPKAGVEIMRIMATSRIAALAEIDDLLLSDISALPRHNQPYFDKEPPAGTRGLDEIGVQISS